MPGQFVNKVYLANNYQDQYGIRIQPETLTLVIDGQQNNPNPNEYTDQQLISVSASRKARRNIARLVTVQFTGVAPEGYSSLGIITLPWLRPEGFDRFQPGMIGSYRDSAITFLRKRDEKLV